MMRLQVDARSDDHKIAVTLLFRGLVDSPITKVELSIADSATIKLRSKTASFDLQPGMWRAAADSVCAYSNILLQASTSRS